MDKLLDKSKEVDFSLPGATSMHDDASLVVEKAMRNMEYSYYRIAEILLFDLFKKEIDQTIEDKIFLPEKVIEKNLSVLQFENKNGVFDNSDINKISYTFFLPTIIGFINNDTKQMYILDSMKSKFCIRNNFCKEENCSECNNFFCNMNGEEMVKQLNNQNNK